MQETEQMIGTTDRTQQIELLSGYMTETEAKALADKYEYMELQGGGTKGSINIQLIAIRAVDMYYTYKNNGWACDETGMEHPDNHKKHPIPKEGNWAVSALYLNYKRKHNGEWEACGFDEMLFGDVIKEYDVDF